MEYPKTKADSGALFNRLLVFIAYIQYKFVGRANVLNILLVE